MAHQGLLNHEKAKNYHMNNSNYLSFVHSKSKDVQCIGFLSTETVSYGVGGDVPRIRSLPSLDTSWNSVVGMIITLRAG